ncbi:hypothetical protein [Acinetobacter colistiniresistens]|uniref:hypothetical protein n=1 Tax=Acinetobacter colistiniresistens TaxID=280145 RepID=UPI00124FA977|nr:hypothetical protein [Acinetobacter colistiniresistens]
MIHEFHNAVRKSVELEKKRSTISKRIVLYTIGEDETLDHGLVSQRLYKTRNYQDVVRICCGISFAHEPLPIEMFYFPSVAELLRLKKLYLD